MAAIKFGNSANKSLLGANKGRSAIESSLAANKSRSTNKNIETAINIG
ncbi:hypothetical protein ACFWM3_23840 [Gottfriedia sp. NPDC058432]